MTTRKMRMMAASLALVLCVSLYSVPRAKAVVTETAIGTAAVASYFQATGLTMAASAGSTGALVTTGIADIAGSYAMATGAASSGSAFLSSLATGVSISPAGALVLTAAAVVAIGALVAWYIAENNLDTPSDTVVVVPGTSDMYSYNGVELPAIPVVSKYPRATISKSGTTYQLVLYTDAAFPLQVPSGSGFGGVYSPSYKSIYFNQYLLTNGVWKTDKIDKYAQGATLLTDIVWSNVDVFYCNTSTPYQSNGVLCLSASTPVPVGDVAEQLEVICSPEFTQPDTEFDTESQKEMVIDLGFAPGITLDEFADAVPDQIAAGTLAPTYEITSTETGEGTDTETDPDEETGIYIPILSDIKTRLNTLADSIVDGVMDGLKSLFVPDEAFFADAVPELQEAFQDRMGLLTFPISLLADFMGRLLNLSDQEPILRWNSVSIYGHQLIAAGQYNLKDALKSAPVKQMYDIYMITVNAIMIFAFLSLCHNKYRKIMQN